MRHKLETSSKSALLLDQLVSLTDLLAKMSLYELFSMPSTKGAFCGSDSIIAEAKGRKRLVMRTIKEKELAKIEVFGG